MSDISESVLGEALPAEWQAKLAQCAPGEVGAIMREYAHSIGRSKDDFDPFFQVPVEAGTAPQKFTQTITDQATGRNLVFEGDSELAVTKQVNAYLRETFSRPTPAAAAATEQHRDDAGRFVNAENAVDVEALRMQMIQGTITPEEFVARSGIIERVVDQRAARAFETSWEQATAAALASPEFANWPGGQEALHRIDSVLKTQGWVDAEDKFEALKAAWAEIQRADYEAALNEKLSTATPSEIRDVLGYGRSSGMFGQR